MILLVMCEIGVDNQRQRSIADLKQLKSVGLLSMQECLVVTHMFVGCGANLCKRESQRLHTHF